MMVLLMTAFGFVAADQQNVDYLKLFLTLIGTALSGGGAAALNNYIERDLDAKMRRTSKRALPLGLIEPISALYFGLVLTVLGVVLLVSTVNLLTAFLALLTTFLYTLVYTPLKRVTWLNTAIGAIPGALPPMGGWVAVSNSLDLGAWILFIILFVWQHPHFYSFAWLNKDDYSKANYKMLPCIDGDGSKTFQQIVLYSVLLIIVAVLPTVFGMSGFVYALGAGFASIWILYLGIDLRKKQTPVAAKKLFAASLVYLPLLFVFVVFDNLII
ncbi:UNVERIFIED_CONTAM: hypothetical protein GTU68_037007 [Idotea baltica]|nr:hypothetical protein [Idotea baltica]